MRAVAGLVLRDVEALLVVLGEHRLAESLGAVGVRAFTDHQDAGVLLERHRDVQRRGARLVRPGCAAAFSTWRTASATCADVLRGGAAAAADQAETELGDETAERLGQFLGGERVLGAVRRRARGSPALGITDTGSVRCLDRCRRCSLISAGPVAQLRPIMSIPSGSSAVSAAPISLPSSMVPVVSTVTWVMIGIRRPELSPSPAGCR